MASAMNLWSNKHQTGRLLAIARPASKKTCLYYERTSQKLTPQKSSTFRQFSSYCGMSSQEGLCVVWLRRPALLWTCGWRSLKMYFSGAVSAGAILSLFVCFRCDGTVLHQTVMIMGFMIFFVLFWLFCFSCVLSCSLRMSLWSVEDSSFGVVHFSVCRTTKCSRSCLFHNAPVWSNSSEHCHLLMGGDC